MRDEFIKILNEALPNGFYYEAKNFGNISLLETEYQFSNILKLNINSNNIDFIKDIAKSNTNEIESKLNAYYNGYKKRKDATPFLIGKWLDNTEKLFNNNTHKLTLEQSNAFNKWINEIIKRDLPLKNSIISAELIGKRFNENNPNTSSVVTSHIENVLYKYSLTINEALKILLDTKGNHSPDWNKNVIPEIINNLKDRKEIDVEPQQSTKESKDFDTNKWNLKTYYLFHYLIEHYENENKVKYINIYYFLKDLAKANNSEYRLTTIIKDYKDFIFEKYGTKLTKFEKAEYKFKDIELPILNDLLKKHKLLLK